MSFPTYELTLHKSYYDKGFFNLGVSVDKFVRSDSGDVTLVLGNANRTIAARVNRNANQNGTPRIYGGAELRNWFFDNYRLKDQVSVTILSPTDLRIG